MLWGVVIVLFIVTAVLLFKLISIKKNMKDIAGELEKTRESGYDRLLRITLIDKDLEKMTLEINNNLEQQKKIKLETEAEKRQMEQSVSDIAHDLRTPLTVIRGNLQMLKEEELSDKGREYLAAADRRAENLKNMVDEFFELSLLESGDVKCEPEKIDVTAFMAEFVIDNESVIRSRELEPDIRLPEKSLIINADKSMLTRVMENLMNNVYKYAKDSFVLEVGEKEGGVSIVLENSIDGDAGIDTGHIFDRTYRADKARSDGSAGLGLYIVKLLVEKMGGSITAAAEKGRLKFEINI